MMGICSVVVRAMRSGLSFILYYVEQDFCTDSILHRLNYLHWLSLRLCGSLVHPSSPKESPNLRVADVGAGSG
jgi:hypothetical protein